MCLFIIIKLKFIYFTESKYNLYFEDSLKYNLCEIYKNLRSEDLFREFNEMVNKEIKINF